MQIKGKDRKLNVRTVIMVQEHIVSVHFSIIFPFLHNALSPVHSNLPFINPRTSSRHSETLIQSLFLYIHALPLSLFLPLISLFVLNVSFLPIILLGNSCGEATQMKMSTEATVPQQIRRIRNNAP